MKKCVYAIAAVIACQAGYGQETRPVAAPPPAANIERLEHLLKAAKHLEAAGSKEEARRVLEQADQGLHALLGRSGPSPRHAADGQQPPGDTRQVLVQVRMVELSLTKLRAMGFDWSSIVCKGPAMGGEAGKGPLPGQLWFHAVDAGSPELRLLEVLKRDRLLKVLAEPKLVTVSGRPACFVSGGELAVPKATSDGSSTKLVEYGTRVDVLPVILPDNTIRIELRLRVSDLDPAHDICVEGQTVPGLRVQEVKTAAELKSGQTLILAGAVQKRVEASNRGVPWISELPYVGALFRCVQEEVNELQQFTLLMPEIVAPMAAPPPDYVQPSPAVPSCQPYSAPIAKGPARYVPQPVPPGAMAPRPVPAAGAGQPPR